MTRDPIPADDCRTMAEVRSAIDALDRELVALLGVRMHNVGAGNASVSSK